MNKDHYSQDSMEDKDKIMYIEPRFNPAEYYYGTYLMVNGKYVGHNSKLGDTVLELFGWKPEYLIPRTVGSYWEKFTDWLWYTYPIGLWVSMDSQ